jgi:mannonate dehydratase
LDGEYYDPKEYMRRAIEMVDYIRSNTDEHLELLHDVHERLTPIDAVGFAADMEKFKLFFLEDLLPPEQVTWFKEVRQKSSTPLAMGELFTHSLEWDQLIRDRLIDFIRVHISMIGGITPARKLAVIAEQSGVLTAWHGPGDLSPVGHAVNVHLDLSVRNFGIQEWNGISERLHEVFPGSPELRNGFVYPPEKPGIGVELNEKLAAQYPPIDEVTRWTQTRLPDGSLNLP